MKANESWHALNNMLLARGNRAAQYRVSESTESNMSCYKFFCCWIWKENYFYELQEEFVDSKCHTLHAQWTTNHNHSPSIDQTTKAGVASYLPWNIRGTGEKYRKVGFGCKKPAKSVIWKYLEYTERMISFEKYAFFCHLGNISLYFHIAIYCILHKRELHHVSLCNIIQSLYQVKRHKCTWSQKSLVLKSKSSSNMWLDSPTALLAI